LTLARDQILSNSATGPANSDGEGGGVFHAGGTLKISDSAVVNNQANHEGGGVWAFTGNPPPNLSRDLIFANTVLALPGQPAQGGGVWLGDGGVFSSTITRNQIIDSSGNPAGAGGGMYGFSATGLSSDTVVGNTAAVGAAAEGGLVEISGTILDGRCDQTVGDFGYNLVQDPACSRGGSTIVAQDFGLRPLADNGGPTQTMAITASSPAYDADPQSNPLAGCGTDQRGVSSLQRGATSCDIGAYQVEAPTTYVANPAAGTVTAYATGASGDAAPVLSLGGPNTELNQPTGVLTDVKGDVFVANAGNNSVTEYAPEVTGDVAPVARIAGGRTALNKPQDLALDGAGRLIVTNLAGGVTEYAPGATGDVAPVARIAGANTLLNKPHGVVIDPDGHLRVSTANGTVNTYAADATGNVAPLSRVTGGALRNPQGLNFDRAGRLVVASPGLGRVDTFAANAAARAQPLSVLTGTPPLQAPTGLDLDEPGNIFVADTATNRMLEFGAGSSGAAAPVATIAGPETGLSSPAFLSELPPTPAPQVRLSTRRRVSRKQVLAGGIVLRLRAAGTLAFRGEPVLVSAVARVRRATIAVARATPLRPGRAVLRLVQTRRARAALRRHRVNVVVVTLTIRDGAGKQTRRVTIRCRG
jgi:hypothetical protein